MKSLLVCSGAPYSKKLPGAIAEVRLRAGQDRQGKSMARASIIGGSLGGLFAALLLRQAGWDVTVFEKSTGDLASRGVGIGTHVEMFEIMRRLGIVVDESIGQSFSSRFCLAQDGSVIARLPFDKILTS